MNPSRPIDAHREALAAARAALEVMAGDLHGAYNDELAELMSEVDALVSLGGGVRADLVLEAKRRGITIDFGKDTRAWIIEFAPSLRQAGASQLAKVVDTVARRTNIMAGCDYNERGSLLFNRESPIALIWARVRAGEVGYPLAMIALAEMDRLEDRLDKETLPAATEAMLRMGIGFGPAAMRDVRIQIIARFGLPDEVDKVQRKLASHAFLSSPQPESGDLTRYTMGLTPEQAAALESALGPLSKPQPNDETGERDLRPNGQRRAEALTEICRRMASADAARRGGPAEADTCVYVTLSLEDLEAGSGAGEVIGSRADGTLLGIETMRKMCCDADLIPVVLGVDGEALDHGMAVRLFTRAQRRAIWRRDRHCTFPGCTAPGAWTKVHHVRHWADGGPTDLANAALLCQRHHTYVHNKRLWAEVNPKPDEGGRCVVWDLVPGSYDRALIEDGHARGWKSA